MSGLELGPILALAGLGALHGLNPAMGWLFAVALGLQEKRGRAVWRALPPLALGHAVSVAAVVAVAVLLGAFIPLGILRWAVALVLLGFGVDRLVRGHRHLKYGGMRVSRADLVVWSFLMATAHGAGLMVLPFIIGGPGSAAAGDAATLSSGHAGHAVHAAGIEAAHAGMLAGQTAGLVASAVHALSYLLVTGVLAVLVYERLGVKLLRTAWINLDVIWAAALVVTAVAVIIPAL
ncbi:MAG TPA: hypothetical protein VK936_01075 [Longimicrobiales bacterium]|nr:hypothetical protein [Longimicrobiales bacterium]